MDENDFGNEHDGNATAADSKTDEGSSKDRNKGGVLKTDIQGFDDLFAEGGIPKGNSVLVAGGTGTGKSTF